MTGHRSGRRQAAASSDARAGRAGALRPRRTAAVLAAGACVALCAAGALAARDTGDALLRLVEVLALLLAACAATAVAALALVLRRRLLELRHLPDLGRPYVVHHEDALVTGLLRDGHGDVVLEVVSGGHQTVVLDEDGIPDRVASGGASSTRWRLPGSAHADVEDLLRLDALLTEQVPVRLVCEGVVALTGPELRAWRLEAANGVVVGARA